MTKLVIVDDHEALREGLVALLRGHGMEVVGAAGNVAAGIEVLVGIAPAVLDVLIEQLEVGDHAVATVPGTAPGEGLRGVPRDVVREQPEQPVHVVPVERVVGAADR